MEIDKTEIEVSIDDMPSIEDLSINRDIFLGDNPYKAQGLIAEDPDFIVKALCLAIIYGNIAKAAKQLGITKQTLHGYKYSNWYPQVEQAIRRYFNQRLDSKLTAIMEGATDAMLERIQHGDVVLTKHGVPVRVPVNLKDASSGLKVAFDKRNQMRGEFQGPQGTSEDIKQQLALLARQFEDIATKNSKKEPLPVLIEDGEIIDKQEGREGLDGQETQLP